MGLDNKVLQAPKPGHEEEFNQLFDNYIRPRSTDQKVVDRYMEISTPAFQTLDAPRVGNSKEADEWMLQHYEHNKEENESKEQFLQRWEGYYALELVKNCDGIPKYRTFEGEAYNFRGQFLRKMEEELGELIHKAYKYLNAKELITYGEELMEFADSYAKKHGTEHVKGDASEDYSELHESKTHLVKNFGRWCLFWGKKGHGMEPYF